MPMDQLTSALAEAAAKSEPAATAATAAHLKAERSRLTVGSPKDGEIADAVPTLHPHKACTR
jgi:hypothetical protein